MRISLLTCLALLLVPAAAAQTDPSVAQPKGEYGCTVKPDSPCRGIIDFDRGSSFEFKFAGSGQAKFQNLGNKRCVMEYSLTAANSATTGKQMSLGPGEVFQVPVGTDSILRFFNRGFGSPSCDMSVALSG